MPQPICPFADEVALLRPEADQRPAIRPIGVSLHTAGTNARARNIRSWFDREEVKEDSHFFVDVDGSLHQWMPVDRRANAQAAGNGHIVSVETWDGGNPSTPWNDQQKAMIARLLVWLNVEWGIVLDTSTRWDGPGIAWHSCYPQWNPDRHGCPGPVRVAQLVHDVLPLARVLAVEPTTGEDDMRTYVGVSVPAPDELGRRMVPLPQFKFDDVTAVTIKANDNGVPVQYVVQPFEYLTALVLSFEPLDDHPVPGSMVGVIVSHQR